MINNLTSDRKYLYLMADHQRFELKDNQIHLMFLGTDKEYKETELSAMKI